MRTTRFDYNIIVKELNPPLGENHFFAKVNISEVGVKEVDHDLGEVWGKTREETHLKMKTLAEQLIQILEK